jgi:hypothetical protein
MTISGSTGSYGTDHGPYVVSSPFSASVEDNISFDWKAAKTSDYYDVYAFIQEGSSTPVQILYERGGSTTSWATRSIE